MASQTLNIRIRDVRRAKRLTLQQLARRCDPPTTAQTIGRLETGMRTVSLAWLNRIAAALDVTLEDLLDSPRDDTVSVAALLDAKGACAPPRAMTVVPPRGGADLIAIVVDASVGDYRTGDEIWCRRVAPSDFPDAVNRDVLVPRPADRFLFGRLVGREDDRLHILPPATGQRQIVVTAPPWIALASRLIRNL